MDFRCSLCGKDRIHHAPDCPFLRNMQVRMQLHQDAKQDFFGAVPNVFVGRHNYPSVNVGLLTAQENDEKYDSTSVWVQQRYQIPDIVGVRSQLVNSSFKAHVKRFDDRLTELSKEVSLSIKPVDVEVNLERKPNFGMTFNTDVTPFGPTVPLKQAHITENPKIPQKVERIVGDTDVKASQALWMLSTQYDQQYLTKVFSVGNLGTPLQRRLVPTRWSITAVDDTIGKHTLAKVKTFPWINEPCVYHGQYFGNHFIVIMLPSAWSYELFEFYAPAGTHQYTTDVEFFDGRKEYVQQTAGGYYASRLPVLNRLAEQKRQATVLVLRFVTNEYYIPLGVWVVREAVKSAMQAKPLTFSSDELLLKYVAAYVKKHFNLGVEHIFAASKVLTQQREQKTLGSFLCQPEAL